MNCNAYESHYKEHEIIGFNNKFATVVLVENLENHLFYISKKIHIGTLPPKDQDAALQELSLLKNLKHPNIVSYIESFLEGEYLIIIMEYCEEGDLSYHIQKRSKHKTLFPEKTILNWLLQLAMALEYIHRNNIIHRDIKSSNIFLTACGSVKIGDFGIAKLLTNTLQAANTLVGTPNYLSPEACDSQPYTNKTDIWALGCVIYELCALKLPFQANNLMELLVKITKEDIEPLPKTYSKEIFRLIKSLLAKDETKRPSCHEILTKPMLIKVMQEFVARDSKGILQKKVPIKQLSIHNEFKKKSSPQKIIHGRPQTKKEKDKEKKPAIRKGSNYDAATKLASKGFKELKINSNNSSNNNFSPIKGKSINSPQSKQKTNFNPINSKKTDHKPAIKTKEKPKSAFSVKKHAPISNNPNNNKNGISMPHQPIAEKPVDLEVTSNEKKNQKEETVSSFLMNTDISLNISLTQDSAFYPSESKKMISFQQTIKSDVNQNGDLIKIEEQKETEPPFQEESDDIFAGIETREDDENSDCEYKDDFEEESEKDPARLTVNNAKETLDDLLDLYRTQLVESQKLNAQSLYEGNLKVIEEELVEMSSQEIAQRKILEELPQQIKGE